MQRDLPSFRTDDVFINRIIYAFLNMDNSSRSDNSQDGMEMGPFNNIHEQDGESPERDICAISNKPSNSFGCNKFLYPNELDNNRHADYRFVDTSIMKDLGYKYSTSYYMFKREDILNDYQLPNFETFSFKSFLSSVPNEQSINVKKYDKIFCSKWLTNDVIVMGTKCKNLLTFDYRTKILNAVPPMSSQKQYSPIMSKTGIYSVSINNSESLLATNSNNALEVSVYKLPAFEPLLVGYSRHRNTIFGICWIDETLFVTVSKDFSLNVWNVNSCFDSPDTPAEMGSIRPIYHKSTGAQQHLRDVVYNEPLREIAYVSSMGRMQVLDVNSLTEKFKLNLAEPKDTMCLSTSTDGQTYVIGSGSSINVIDSRIYQHNSMFNPDNSKNFFGSVLTNYASIRSISLIKNTYVTTGHVGGDVSFYDLRKLDLKTSMLLCEPVKPLDNFLCGTQNLMSERRNSTCPTLYTHCYDSTGTRLLTAGGDYARSSRGCYAAVWDI